MTTDQQPARLERSYDATPRVVWQTLTTQWWVPDGFQTRVTALDLRPGGEVHFTLTAVGPEQVAYMNSAGLPLSSKQQKTFTEVVQPRRLAYRSVIDWVPGHPAYDHLTTIDFTPYGDGTALVMTLDPLHDDAWTVQHREHRNQELDNLAVALRRPRG